MFDGYIGDKRSLCLQPFLVTREDEVTFPPRIEMLGFYLNAF